MPAPQTPLTKVNTQPDQKITTKLKDNLKKCQDALDMLTMKLERQKHKADDYNQTKKELADVKKLIEQYQDKLSKTGKIY